MSAHARTAGSQAGVFEIAEPAVTVIRDAATVSYQDGDEADCLFWDIAGDHYLADGTMEHVSRSISTAWQLPDLLAAAAQHGLTVDPLFTRRYHPEYQPREMVADVSAAPGEDGNARSGLMLLRGNGDPEFGFSVQVSLAGPDKADLEWLLGALLDDAPPAPKPKPVPRGKIAVTFTYHAGAAGPQSFTRRIDAPRWAKIRENYPEPVAARLDELITAGPAGQTGHVGVLHGAPGSGKSTFLRALAQEWRRKAEFIYVTDTEKLFNDTAYLMSTVTQAHGTCNLLICEDAEEFLKEDAKADVGQALSRLLNLGDGMLGQGLNMLVLFTTNVKVAELNPAIIRPGRCFLNHELPPFSVKDASAWLEAHGATPGAFSFSGPQTLAQLYDLLRQHEVEQR
jgi:hypothetical protein